MVLPALLLLAAASPSSALPPCQWQNQGEHCTDMVPGGPNQLVLVFTPMPAPVTVVNPGTNLGLSSNCKTLTLLPRGTGPANEADLPDCTLSQAGGNGTNSPPNTFMNAHGQVLTVDPTPLTAAACDPSINPAATQGGGWTTGNWYFDPSGPAWTFAWVPAMSPGCSLSNDASQNSMTSVQVNGNAGNTSGPGGTSSSSGGTSSASGSGGSGSGTTGSSTGLGSTAVALSSPRAGIRSSPAAPPPAPTPVLLPASDLNYPLMLAGLAAFLGASMAAVLAMVRGGGSGNQTEQP
jgi:hypothetical protein